MEGNFLEDMRERPLAPPDVPNCLGDLGSGGGEGPAPVAAEDPIPFLEIEISDCDVSGLSLDPSDDPLQVSHSGEEATQEDIPPTSDVLRQIEDFVRPSTEPIQVIDLEEEEDEGNGRNGGRTRRISYCPFNEW